MLISVMRDVI